MKRILLDGIESNYVIDEQGRIFNITNNKELKGSITESGYKYFRLSQQGKKFRFYVHRLVAEYYLTNNDSTKIVNHKNGNKLDNRVENLEWITHSENNIHANATGLRRSNKNKRQEFNVDKDSYKDENWVTIPGYSNYLISSYGRVCSKHKTKSFLIKPVLVNGYYKVSLSKNGNIEDKLVAYLVYFSFNLEEKEDNKVIDHIDGNKTNNKLSNLRYISRSDNTKMAYYSQNVQSNINSVVCYKDNKMIGVYPSCREAARSLNCDASAISKCCRGIYSKHHGYVFLY